MLRQTTLRRATCSPTTAARLRTQAPHRTIFSRRDERMRRSSSRAVENIDIRRMTQQAQDWHRNRTIFLWSGAIAGVISAIYTAWKIKVVLDNPVKADSNLPPSDPLASPNAADRKVVIHDQDGREIVPTGNSTVPTFPHTLDLPAYTAPITPTEVPTSPVDAIASQQTITTPNGSTTEYTLVGLGLRTVTFLGLQVYVVGYYIATADIAALQSALTKKINPIATTLVPGEREQLRAALLDPTEGERTWEELLAAGIPARSAFRVVPVRDTDFHHLRDGFVRAIQARAPPTAPGADDEAFGQAMRQFRGVFSHGSVPKRRELLLVRDETGRLSIAYDAGKKKTEAGQPSGRQLIGVVEDERVSRALWLNYLAGKKVASEPARQNIVEGIMGFVERPVGTVAAQVVPVVNSRV
ncbi:chalcone-flavanone isomerase-domain-containing protein [Chaetomium sp. MPI-SDFR-AT-0129]|nr:chalcone-flavanone isomerase-domain-containing protein [Chaetomium sp. MPI-SDFR-AT-0129]